jgi:hypothetical protein
MDARENPGTAPQGGLELINKARALKLIDGATKANGIAWRSFWRYTWRTPGTETARKEHERAIKWSDRHKTLLLELRAMIEEERPE